MSGIVFQVETTRVLQILASEIYDSPLALLRENVQNAYDAIRMRFATSGELSPGGMIEISVDRDKISIADNGIGMNEQVLKENFWKPGASGKHTEDAHQAGVVGTFGIGAMANFGVCSRLEVETRANGTSEVLKSVAERDSLKIGEECISFERGVGERDIGTTVTAFLDAEHPISPEQAADYLAPYVRLLPVPVLLNGTLISKQTMESGLSLSGRDFASIGTKRASDSLCAANFDVRADTNGQILVVGTDIQLSGVPIQGSVALLQGGGQLMGLRSQFGLAPIPAIGNYQFGGYADLSFLQPTAGREAVSRDSIGQVTHLIGLAEQTASELLALTPGADKNTSFLQWLVSHGRYDLAARVSIRLLPDEKDVELAQVKKAVGDRSTLYYTGADQQIRATFSGDGSCLLQVAQVNPRRQVQLHYLTNTLGVKEVPSTPQVRRIYDAKELSIGEASILVRIAGTLRDDYLLGDVDVVLADISHGVTILPEKLDKHLRLYLARSSALLPPLLEFYQTAYELFSQFMKDFVRVHIYPRIQQFVPSSTRDGVDVLRKLLQKNKELFRYEETERGDFEGILGEFLSGAATLTQVMNVARSSGRAQTQRVSSDQVGTIEAVAPTVVESPITQQAAEGFELEPRPPIIREDITSEMKILTTAARYPQLNNFVMLLGVSDGLMRTQGEFFRSPHTTRILWGGHRVIFIFTEATGRVSLYYDIELREAIEHSKASGGMFPTTTLITQKRIFIPVPDTLTSAFQVSTGPKEFFVRFDLLSTDVN